MPPRYPAPAHASGRGVHPSDGLSRRDQIRAQCRRHGRSLHLPRFLRALLSELERLWPADAPSRLVIRCGDETATLLRRRQKLSQHHGARSWLAGGRHRPDNAAGSRRWRGCHAGLGERPPIVVVTLRSLRQAWANVVSQKPAVIALLTRIVIGPVVDHAPHQC